MGPSRHDTARVSASAAQERPRPATLAVTPAKDTKNLPISTEIGTKVTNGKVQAVVLADASGTALPGKLRDDLTSWVPDNPLKFATAQ